MFNRGKMILMKCRDRKQGLDNKNQRKTSSSLLYKSIKCVGADDPGYAGGCRCPMTYIHFNLSLFVSQNTCSLLSVFCRTTQNPNALDHHHHFEGTQVNSAEKFSFMRYIVFIATGASILFDWRFEAIDWIERIHVRMHIKVNKYTVWAPYWFLWIISFQRWFCQNFLIITIRTVSTNPKGISETSWWFLTWCV